MNIATIREALDQARWTRLDFLGATREEFKRLAVEPKLMAQIEVLRALPIPPHRVAEMSIRAHEIQAARTTIGLWKAARAGKNVMGST